MTALRSLAIWFAILWLAIANGALRESVLVPGLGRSAGLAASGLLLSLLVLAITFACIRWIGLRGRGWALGAGWLALTLAFEFGFGLVQHKTWAQMRGAYLFADGNLWPLVLLVILVAPPLACAVRRPWRPVQRPVHRPQGAGA